MESVVYVGPYEGVDIPTLNLTVQRNVPFEVESSVARSLCDQPVFKPAAQVPTKAQK